MMPDINNRIKQVIENKTDGIVSKFAQSIGLPQQTVNRLFIIDKRTGKYPVATTDILQKISEKYEDISAAWLLTGTGTMILSRTADPQAGIPLIHAGAMAGAFKGGPLAPRPGCERYVVPVFTGAEFLTQVCGLSMMPKLLPGDIVACRRMPEGIFYQWNKVYLLDTVQGILVKRVKPGRSDDTLSIVSDNPEYPPFELMRTEIYNVAIIVGLIRIE